MTDFSRRSRNYSKRQWNNSSNVNRVVAKENLAAKTGWVTCVMAPYM